MTFILVGRLGVGVGVIWEFKLFILKIYCYYIYFNIYTVLLLLCCCIQELMYILMKRALVKWQIGSSMTCYVVNKNYLSIYLLNTSLSWFENVQKYHVYVIICMYRYLHIPTNERWAPLDMQT